MRKYVSLQGSLLLAVAFICLLTTGLNHYVTLQSAAYFHKAGDYETMRLANIQATSVAQGEARAALTLAQLFASDREKYARVAENYSQQLKNYDCAYTSAVAYIRLLEAELTKRNIKLPEPNKSSPEKNTQVYKLNRQT